MEKIIFGPFFVPLAMRCTDGGFRKDPYNWNDPDNFRHKPFFWAELLVLANNLFTNCYMHVHFVSLAEFLLEDIAYAC